MHSKATAIETLKVLWQNYLTLGEAVDLDMMTPEALAAHIQRKSLVRPFTLAAWAARQGFFIAAWALWEYYSRKFCETLNHIEEKRGNESPVDWVARSLQANQLDFADKEWFRGAYSLRNLIAHHGARVAGPKAEGLLTRSQTALSDLQIFPDRYVAIEHAHVADLMSRIDGFIGKTAPSTGTQEAPAPQLPE